MLHLIHRSHIGLRHALLIAALLAAAGCSSSEQRAQAYYERGMQLLSDGDYVGASLELRNAVKLKDNMPAAWLALARIEEHNKNWPAVAASLRAAVRHDPKDIESRLKLARLMLLGNARDEALKLVDDVSGAGRAACRRAGAQSRYPAAERRPQPERSATHKRRWKSSLTTPRH